MAKPHTYLAHPHFKPSMISGAQKNTILLREFPHGIENAYRQHVFVVVIINSLLLKWMWEKRATTC